MKRKINKAGALVMFHLFSQMMYVLSSEKGSWRGGKSRTKQKTFIVLFGDVYSYTFENGKQKIHIPRPITFYSVPSSVPHLMEFKSYSWVIEWWHKDYSEEKFEPFYSKKQA